MPATLQRPKRQSKPKTVYRLTTGSWGGASSGAPDFGPVNPPDAIRTERIVKDVLPLGKWHNAGEVWDVTPKVLAQIAEDFRRMKAAGNEPNLGKTHGDDALLIHPDDLIAPIDDVKVFGNSLWASIYVTPEQKDYLDNPARKVSVGVVPDYQDGAGNHYQLALIHVAVTDRPVVVPQGPFLSLANEAGGGSMNPDLLDAINVLMEAAGLGKLGDVADEAALIEQLKGVAAALGKETSKEEPPPDAGGATGDLNMDLPMPGVPAPMAKSIRDAITMATKAQTDRIKTLETQLADEKAATLKKAETDFMASADRLVKAGATVADVNRAKLLAKKYGYDQSFLEGIATPLNRGGAAKTLASALPPGGQSEEDRKTEVANDIAKMRGISVEAARKFVP